MDSPANGSTSALRVPSANPPCYVFETASSLSRHVAQLVAGIIRERNALGQKAVLGLPTGSTPVDVYRELIRMHQEEDLDFSQVVTFNLDEYYPIRADQLQSFRRWMMENFFQHINLPPEQTHVPDSAVPQADMPAYCRHYEQLIEEAGGIDIMLLGIGRNGSGRRSPCGNVKQVPWPTKRHAYMHKEMHV